MTRPIAAGPSRGPAASPRSVEAQDPTVPVADCADRPLGVVVAAAHPAFRY